MEDTSQNETSEETHGSFPVLRMWNSLNTSMYINSIAHKSLGCLKFLLEFNYCDMIESLATWLNLVSLNFQLPSLPRRSGLKPQPSNTWLGFVAWPAVPVLSHPVNINSGVIQGAHHG